MAHFAELNENNVVTRVIVVDNQETHDANGIESEELGIAFCRRLFGLHTKWRQTSYSGSIRVRYAGVGFTYDENLDAFIAPKPYPSWILNSSTTTWEAPVPKPTLPPTENTTNYWYIWDEETQNWLLRLPDTEI